jgi:hypothetical protein
MHIPERFLGAIGGDPGNCVLVVGAGLSTRNVRRRGAGIPAWDELIHLMIRNLEEAGRCDATRIDQLSSMAKEDTPRYLEVAEEFWKAHSDDRDGYETFLRRYLKPDDLVESDLHKMILKTGFWGIASFNFDMVFERQSDKLGTIVYPELMEQIGHFQRRGFFAKVHGCISRPASRLVLTSSSYDELRRHPNYRALLATVLLAHKVLCVGFSLRDPNFQSILADLKNFWDSDLPPLFALMKDPGEAARSEWLSRGVDVIPYREHEDIHQFFAELAALSPSKASLRYSSSGKRASKVKPTVVGSNRQNILSHASICNLLGRWQQAQKLEEMDQLISAYLEGVPGAADREELLFRLCALARPNQLLHLCRPLVSLKTPACQDLAAKLLRDAAEEGDLSRLLKPHAQNVILHQWLMDSDVEWPFQSRFNKSLRSTVAWLLDGEWSAHGINLWATFLGILSRLRSNPARHGLDDLYTISEHIPGAAAELEKIVLAADFVREDDRERREKRWFKSWDEQIVRAVQIENFKRWLRNGDRSPHQMLAEATSREASLGEDEHHPYTEMVAEWLLTEFVHATHLTLHSSSGSYNPLRSREILDALASLRKPRQQLTVLWAVNHWPERMRGLISAGEDSRNLRENLLVPLWWRYSTSARIEYLRQHHRGFSPYPEWTGQEFFMERIMGLRYNMDEDFREEFIRNHDIYRRKSRPDEYEPRPLQELWIDLELRYEVVEDCPPELVRRIAVRWAEWENSRSGSVRWAEARNRAREVFENPGKLHKYVSAQRKDYVIDNLLGAYIPSSRRVLLYGGLIAQAAVDLDIDEDALMTIVYIHESAHAFVHLGRDLDRRMWQGFGLPDSSSVADQVSRPHEAIAQYYSFKLLVWLEDQRLLGAFSKLEACSDPIYRAWRETEHLTLEEMRYVLIRNRSTHNEWPPR